MDCLHWSDSFNTGIAEIDNQHRQLIDYLNQLSEAHTAQNRKAVGEVIEGLVDYTLSHFAFEESLMEEVEYPFARAHKKIHEMFVKRVAGFQARFKEGQDVTEEFYTLLKRWLIQHIQRDDMAYSTPVKTKMNLLTEEKTTTANTAPKGNWFTRSIKKFFNT